MFYSQMLLSMTGALGIVWLAAHCQKRLRKCDVQRTDISSYVDKILGNEVKEVTHRILAFLLLGLVKIHSKKAEYLFNDCHEMLNRLSSIQTRKSKQAEIGVSQTHYHSISLPKRFELDAFDLELLEDQDEAGGNVRPHGKDKLADWRRKDASTSGLLRKENAQISEAYSMAYTPPKDVFGHPHTQNLFMAPTNNKKISLAGVEVLRGSHFPLEDHIYLDLEQIHKRQTDEDPELNIQGPSSDVESDSYVGPSNYRSHPLPSLEIVCGSWFGLEDRLEPLVLDEAEEEQLNGWPSNHKEQVQDMELVCGSWFGLEDRLEPMVLDEAEEEQLNGRPSNYKEQVQDMELDSIYHQSSLEQLPNEAEKGQGHETPPDKEHRLEEEHMEHLCTEFNLQESEHQDFTASVDKAKPVDAGDNVPEVITLESVKSQRPEELRVSIVTSDSKLPAGAGISEIAFVQTPGGKEHVKIPMKRRTLFDSTTVIVPNEEFKNWIGNTTDLKRERRKVPCTLLGAWRANKRARFPKSFSEPSIPGISVALECNKSYVAAPKMVELSSEAECVNSPVTYEAQEQIPAVRSPIRETSPKRTLDDQSLVIEVSSKQAPIAPGTPSAAHMDQLRSHEFGAVADSDILEPSASYESVVKGPSLSEPLGFDVLYDEETSSFEGDSSKKGDTFSKRTRMAGSYLSTKFLEKKSRKEEEVVSLSHLLEGKTKKESARFFYETLVLKTRDCIDVQQGAAYHDIVLRETPKLRQLLDS
ncbi:hypothetical protein ACS0TY_028090 [Phlomoides rotata]